MEENARNRCQRLWSCGLQLLLQQPLLVQLPLLLLLQLRPVRAIPAGTLGRMQPRWLGNETGGVLELVLLLLQLALVLLLLPQRRQLHRTKYILGKSLEFPTKKENLYLLLALLHRRYPLPHLLARRHLRNRERRRWYGRRPAAAIRQHGGRASGYQPHISARILATT